MEAYSVDFSVSQPGHPSHMGLGNFFVGRATVGAVEYRAMRLAFFHQMPVAGPPPVETTPDVCGHRQMPPS